MYDSSYFSLDYTTESLMMEMSKLNHFATQEKKVFEVVWLVEF